MREASCLIWSHTQRFRPDAVRQTDLPLWAREGGSSGPRSVALPAPGSSGAPRPQGLAGVACECIWMWPKPRPRKSQCRLFSGRLPWVTCSIWLWGRQSWHCSKQHPKVRRDSAYSSGCPGRVTPPVGRTIRCFCCSLALTEKAESELGTLGPLPSRLSGSERFSDIILAPLSENLKIRISFCFNLFKIHSKVTPVS